MINGGTFFAKEVVVRDGQEAGTQVQDRNTIIDEEDR